MARQFLDGARRDAQRGGHDSLLVREAISYRTVGPNGQGRVAVMVELLNVGTVTWTPSGAVPVDPSDPKLLAFVDDLAEFAAGLYVGVKPIKRLGVGVPSGFRPRYLRTEAKGQRAPHVGAHDSTCIHSRVAMNTSASSDAFAKITSRETLPSISSPETDALDWKMQVDASKRIELAKDMAAIANASGGSIVIGVKEGSATVKAAPKPLSQQEVRLLARAYEEAARDHISPPPTIDTAAIELERDGSDRWVLAVNISPTEAIFCAVRVKNQTGEDAWRIPKRVASQTKYLTPADAQLLTVNKLRSATHKTLSLIEAWQDDLDRKERVRRFEQFMEDESHHDICLPGLASEDSPLGLHYTIRPVRDAQGRPLHDVGEMRSRWVVEVVGPAHESVMSTEDLKEYDSSPICDGEYYYCEFYNDSWHMSDGNLGQAQPFYLSGKVGQVEYLEPANEFVERHRKLETDHTSLFDVLLDLQGKQPSGSGAGNRYSVLTDKVGRLFLRINNSPPKQMYMTNPVNSYGDTGWYFKIEKLRGHGNKDVLSNIRESILRELQQRSINIPKIPWYQTDQSS